MTFDEIIDNLKKVGNEKIKNRYLSLGAREPLFGVSNKEHNVIVKSIIPDNTLADKLFNTNNYDCMYLAGMIIDTKTITKDIIINWINLAYSNLIIDFIISISLVECPFCEKLSNELIRSNDDKKVRCGYFGLSWYLESVKNENINEQFIFKIVEYSIENYKTIYINNKDSLNKFLYSISISYLPLANKVISICEELYYKDNNFDVVFKILKDIKRVGFKRKGVRC
jgi:hypothetical protein